MARLEAAPFQDRVADRVFQQTVETDAGLREIRSGLGGFGEQNKMRLGPATQAALFRGFPVLHYRRMTAG